MALHASTAGAEPDLDEFDFDWDTAEDDLSAVSYEGIPWIPRRWTWKGHIPVASPVIFAGKGAEGGKGMLFALVAARVVLGLPFPGEDQDIRREPRRVVWIAAGGEDDQFEDLAPRLRDAIAYAVAEFGLDAELAHPKTGAVRLVHDLSEWRGGDPVSIPGDCARIAAELLAIVKRKGGPPVGLVVADSLTGLLSAGYTIDSRQGARRTMNMLSRFARRADVAFAVIHHLTKDGKVAGSADVLNAVRLAFVIEFDKDTGLRTIVRHKANISDAVPQMFAITGPDQHGHAEFRDATDTRAERVAQAAEAGTATETGRPDGLHARVAAEAGAEPGGLWRVLRHASATDASDVLSSDAGGGDVARSMAGNDAGTELAWTPDGRKPWLQVAVRHLGDGSKVSYAVFPVPEGAPGHV
jgi:AAA domain